MKHVSTLTSATLKQTAAHGGCGECRRFQMSMGAPWARLAMYIGGNNKK